MSQLVQNAESHELSDVLEKLGQEAARLQTVIDTVPSILWTSFPDGSKEYLNKRWYEYSGLTQEQGKGWDWKVAVHPDDLNRLLRELLALVDARKPGELETRVRRYDGEYRWFLIRVVPQLDAGGNVVRWFGSNTDIEDRKRAETKLLDDERELRWITDAIPHTIVVLNPKGNALYANHKMLDDTGLTMQDVLTSDFRARIYHPEDLERALKGREEGLARGLPFEIEQRVLWKDGQYRWLLLRYNPFRDEHGRLVRWYATGTDIDDRRRAEDRTKNENIALREDVDHSSMFEEIVGSSPSLRKVLKSVDKVAATDSTVLILGETGTGKELIARAIHKRSRRSTRAFIRVNCAAIPQALIASELFGHEKGAFTGAVERRVGRFETADGGTLLLDEIGDLPPETQIALLRVLQEREFERVGNVNPIPIDVRVLAATNKDLGAAVADGTFRQDLYYRLNVFPVSIPPLRERTDDIPLLVEYLIERYAKKAGKKINNIERSTLELFKAYNWPGNVRELQNVIERGVILCETATFSVDESWFGRESKSGRDELVPLSTTLTKNEREIIEKALAESAGQVGGANGAAARLGIPRQTLDSKIKLLGINKFHYKKP
jgi:formate hydrogenlyase transcriptional activator